MCLIEDDAFPLVLIEPGFVEFGHFGELVRDGAVCGDDYVVTSELLDKFVPFGSVITHDADFFGVFADLRFPLA
jgi:hypothetical protein